MYLPLAERMTLKYIKEDKIEAEAGEEYHYFIRLISSLPLIIGGSSDWVLIKVLDCEFEFL